MRLSATFREKNGLYHLAALLAVVVWGTTFVSTKILLASGLNPAEIMFYRFLIAYVVLWCCSPHIRLPKNPKDESMFALAGISGGSLYFLTENTALQLTQASNVALLLGTAPILTVLLSRLLLKNEPVRKSLAWGSCIALLGVGFVVYNGSAVLRIHPLGDLLTLTAALTWALYNIMLKRLDGKYATLEITRKVFFYGLLTLTPVFFFTPMTFRISQLLQPRIMAHLLFLGLAASFLCYIIWNAAVKRLGTVCTSNYIYIVPLVTLIASSLILHERITGTALTGAALILGGVYTAVNGRSPKSFKLFKKHTHETA